MIQKKSVQIKLNAIKIKHTYKSKNLDYYLFTLFILNVYQKLIKLYIYHNDKYKNTMKKKLYIVSITIHKLM